MFSIIATLKNSQTRLTSSQATQKRNVMIRPTNARRLHRHPWSRLLSHAVIRDEWMIFDRWWRRRSDEDLTRPCNAETKYCASSFVYNNINYYKSSVDVFVWPWSRVSCVIAAHSSLTDTSFEVCRFEDDLPPLGSRIHSSWESHPQLAAQDTHSHGG